MRAERRTRRRPTIEAIARLVAAGTSHEDAARQLGIHARIVTRHRQAIDDRVAELRGDLATDALNALGGALGLAVRTLTGTLQDEHATPATRARAATALISQFVTLREHDDLAERISAMERHFERDQR